MGVDDQKWLLWPSCGTQLQTLQEEEEEGMALDCMDSICINCMAVVQKKSGFQLDILWLHQMYFLAKE